MIVDTYKDQKVLILGFGLSGQATAHALHAGGAHVVVWDDRPTMLDQAKQQGFAILNGVVHGVDRLNELNGQAAQAQKQRTNALDSNINALIVSPGIPHLYPEPHPVIAWALMHHIPIDNDIGVLFSVLAAKKHQTPVIAITGTNGKSTTAVLLHHILQRAGHSALCAGNIGQPVLSLPPITDSDSLILELSSYQIELAQRLDPDIAVFLNFYPDHLTRHAGIGGYFAAKARLFTFPSLTHAVIGVFETEGEFLALRLQNQPQPIPITRLSNTYHSHAFAGTNQTVFLDNNTLIDTRHGERVASIDLTKFTLKGIHNQQNACAAYSVARLLGVSTATITKALADFKGLPHRSQIVAKHGNVTFVNDSKATNVQSTIHALQNFKQVRWIAGGQAKDENLNALCPYLSSVVKAYIIGNDMDHFARVLSPIAYELCGTMKRAVACAIADAQSGDVVLLSPATASFDQYAHFAERGDDFVAEVKSHIACDMANSVP